MFYPMRQWDPFDALERIFSLWDPQFFGSPWPVMPRLPQLNVQQEAQDVIIQVAVPGISPEDLSVTVNENVLTIRAVRRSVESGSQGDASGVVSFERSFTLPSTVDPNGVKARYHQGMLEITIPKTQGPTGRQIPIDLE